MNLAFNPFTGTLDLVGPTPSTSGANYIENPNDEIDTSLWNLYNDAGRTVSASLTNQDVTFTSTLSGSGGNGVEIEYIYNAAYPSSTPNINVISPTHVQVQWNNGPTVANNPTATQLVAAWNGVPAAVAIATIAITGTAGNLQYITGAEFLSSGGDAAPTNGTGGVPAGVTFTRSTVSPIVGNASFVLTKDAANRQGQGVSIDFSIDNIAKGELLEVSFAYDGSSGMAFGSGSDVTVWIYDVTNASLIPIAPKDILKGPASTIVTLVGTFIASQTSTMYRLIFHISTVNAIAWTLQLDEVTVTNNFSPTVTAVESVVLSDQAVSGTVTDHMAVMWTDGAAQWVPATSTWNADQTILVGFATNIAGGFASVYIRGYMTGFSFGPFAGYDQYVDPSNPGGLTPLPAPFVDTYLIMGRSISATEFDIQPFLGIDTITSKGGLLSNAGLNNGTGDQVLPVGADGDCLTARSASALGLAWQAAVVCSAPLTYTLATRTLTIAVATDSIPGVMSAADHTSLTADTAARHNAVTIGTANGLSLSTQILSLAASTDSVPGALTAADHTTYTGYAASIALKAPLASPTFTGTPSLPTGTTGVTQAALDSTTKLATTAFVTTAGNLKAPLASPSFTGDVNSSTGNVLISTLGKGLQVKTGVNSKIGTAVLVAGTKTVTNTSITANSLVFITSQADGGTPAAVRITAKVVGASFTITSLNVLDTSTVAWMIVEMIP